MTERMLYRRGMGDWYAWGDDTDLIFVTQVGTTEIKVSFDPQKMVDDEGIDI